MVFVDRGGAPALAERGLTFGGGGACEWRQGSTLGAKAQDLPLSR